MSSDLVKRLRAFRPTYGWPEEQATVFKKSLGEEAADRIEALEREVERLTTNGTHSCHDQCQRVPCVQGREIRRLQEALKEIAVVEPEWGTGGTG